MELDPKKMPNSTRIAARWIMDAYKKLKSGLITEQQYQEIIINKTDDVIELQKDIDEEAKKKRGGKK